MMDPLVIEPHWKRVGGTPAGAYYQIEPGILVAVPRQDFVQTALDARRSLVEFYRIADEMRRALVLVILVDRVASQDGESRRMWAGETDRSRYRALALVCSRLLARAIGSFYMGLHRPAIPTRMFRTFDEALGWARSLAPEEER